MGDDNRKIIKITGDGISGRVHVEHSGLAMTGFWIALGLVAAALIIAGKL